jgi:PAS domain S-box-containing protein
MALTAISFVRTEVNRRRPGEGFLYGQLVHDLFLITSVVHLTGGAESQFSALYILVMAAAALLLPIGSSLLLAMLGSVLYVGDAFLVSGGTLTLYVVLQLVVFTLVAVGTGYIAARLQEAGEGRQRLQEELARMQLRAADILANIRSGIITVDHGGKLLYANPAAAAMLGLAVDQEVGTPVLARIARTAPGVADALVAHAAGGVVTARREGSLLRNGVPVPVGITTTSVSGDLRQEGQATTAIFQDITDQKRLEAMHLRAQRLEAVAELSASLAHEIKNPLASIHSAVEQMSRRPTATADERTLAALIVRESERLSRLLSEFLDFARVQVTRRDPLDLRHLVQGAATLAGTHPDRGDQARLSLELPDGPLMMQGDEDLLHRALFNLILNAFQASPSQGRGPGPAAHPAARPATDGAAVRRSGPRDRDPRPRHGHPFRDRGPAVRALRDDEARRQRARTRDGASRDRGPQGADPRGQPRDGHLLHRPPPTRAARARSHPVSDRPTSPSVLIVDDESGILQTLEILLRAEGFTPHVAQGGKAALEKLQTLSPDIVLSDVRMPQVTGVEVLAAAKAKDPDVPVILMTAQATLQTAMQAVNEGAFYYIQKPFRNDELLAILRRAAEHRMLRMENTVLKKEIRKRERRGAGAPVGQNRAWLDVLRLAEAVAPTESTVLVTGESGTGKEVVARYIHDLSGRADSTFQSINCGALPEGLLESELFGHVKGSFTGATRDKQGLFTAAGGGTFFLDEIGETTPATQVKLLRVLQHREVIPVGATEPIPIDTRIIAATNRDLEEEIKRGNFRRDLFYRLNVISVHLPPLRERRDDIVLLAEGFLQRSGEQRQEAPKRLGDDAVEAMLSYAWPGNVRELENALERAVILSTGTTIGVTALPERVSERQSEPLVAERATPNPTLETIERAYILFVLQAEQGNKTRAAEMLGIDPSTLHRKLARYGVEA